MKVLTAVVLSFCMSVMVRAQEIERCATMQMDSLLRLRFPGLGTLDEFESAMQRKILERKQLALTGKVTDEVITIPVVVHVIHNGEAVGTGSNISEAQVISQIETLNEDFRKAINTPGYNTHARGADIEINFRLAVLNPQGQVMAEPGINRVSGGRASWLRDQVENLKTYTIWDPTLYYNIWVVNFSEGASLLGYAQFPVQSGLSGIPESGGGSTDGVVVHVRAFGNSKKGNFPNLLPIYNQGRSLTHETGHWLGLRHIWGDSNCGNDFCDDTPPQASESRGCRTGRQSCGGVNMVENYMDYSDDACYNIFTLDQKTRMRTVMASSPRRRELVNSNVLGNTIGGVPVARFISDRQQVLLDGQVQFTDRSLNAPSSWKWTFEGGTPATSTERNPLVTYSQAGRYAVDLTVSNTHGTHTESISGFIEVLNAGQCSEKTNFTGTESLIRDESGGYVAGQNGNRIQAVSEYFENPLGYTSVSSTYLKFGRAFARDGAQTEAVVNVVVWNARGFQGGPGSVLEYKEVPLRQILSDVANRRETHVIFNREVPVSGKGFHIGYEIVYQGDTVALYTTRDGESLNGTSWQQDEAGEWDLNLRRSGLNIAHHIEVIYGMKPSVQLAGSAVFVNPGEAVTLQASGAGVYNWTETENMSTTLGPMVVIRPNRTQTYHVTGSGTDICVDSASITIYVRNIAITGTEPDIPEGLAEGTILSPNPTSSQIRVTIDNRFRGRGSVSILTVGGARLTTKEFEKTQDKIEEVLEVPGLSAGLYLVEILAGSEKVVRRIVKY